MCPTSSLFSSTMLPIFWNSTGRYISNSSEIGAICLIKWPFEMFQQYGKFWKVLLDNLIKHKPPISEEWLTNVDKKVDHCSKFRNQLNPIFFPLKNKFYTQTIIYIPLRIYICNKFQLTSKSWQKKFFFPSNHDEECFLELFIDP